MLRQPRLFAGSVASLVVVAFVGSAASAQAATQDTFAMTVDGTVGTTVDGNNQFQIGGDTPVAIKAAHLDGGKMTVVAGPDASLPKAVGFPAYVGSGTYPRAVLNVTPTSGDALSPGSSDFEYGAVFRLDSTSAGRSSDNGDNVFQRGRYGDSSMFKLQVDHGYPSCLVKGSQGQVLVSSPTKVVKGAWYSATCSRIGPRVMVEVAPYARSADTLATSVSGGSGTLTFDPGRAASVGGKLNRSGGVSASTDQFNGAVATVWIHRIP